MIFVGVSWWHGVASEIGPETAPYNRGIFPLADDKDNGAGSLNHKGHLGLAGGECLAFPLKGGFCGWAQPFQCCDSC